MRVDWSASNLQTLRAGVAACITDAIGDDYQIAETWENLSTPVVVMVGAGWAGHTAKGANYKMDIYTLYASYEANPESAAEEMMRRVWVALSYATDSDSYELGDVSEALSLTLGEGDNAVRYAGYSCRISCVLDLTPMEV